MNLNPVMLEEAKNVIYNECGLPESNKEPVHLAVKNLFMLEFAYKDFLSREMAGEVLRAKPACFLVEACGGNADNLMDWFLKYEQPSEEIKSAGIAPAWES